MNRSQTRAALPLLLLAVAWVCVNATGCAATPSTQPPDGAVPAWLAGLPASATTPPDGTIFRADTGLALFEDLRARRVGDILTVVLDEATNASKNSSTSTKKSTSNNSVTATLLGIPVTSAGNAIFDNSVQGDHEFSGEGGASQSNQLEGSVTVTVVRRLPNGNLVVSGEKWLTLNQGKEYVRVSGIVRPIDIGTDNSVPSQKVANARIEYSGRGALADANQMNWLARFFNSPWLPF